MGLGNWGLILLRGELFGFGIGSFRVNVSSARKRVGSEIEQLAGGMERSKMIFRITRCELLFLQNATRKFTIVLVPFPGINIGI